jgi:predicted DNA-binding transcriptional regulator AlpA
MGKPASETIVAELLTLGQAAWLLGIGPRTLWRYSRSGMAPAPIQCGHAVRYRRSELLVWIRQGCPRLRNPENEQSDLATQVQ